jgi:hypothetical protein
VATCVRIPSLVLNVAELFFLKDVTARYVDTVICDPKEHGSFIVADEVIGYDTLDSIVQKCRVFSIEETGPETEDVIDVVLAETPVTLSRTLIMVVAGAVILVIGRR